MENKQKVSVDQTEALMAAENSGKARKERECYVSDDEKEFFKLEDVEKYKFDVLRELNETTFDLRVVAKAVERLKALRPYINSRKKHRKLLIRYGVFLGQWYRAVLGGEWVEDDVHYGVMLETDYDVIAWPFAVINHYLSSTDTDDFPLLEFITHTWVESKVARDCWQCYVPQIPR